MSQYRTAIQILCAGAPLTSGEGRRNCQSHITAKVSSWQQRKQYHELREILSPTDWRMISTYKERK